MKISYKIPCCRKSLRDIRSFVSKQLSSYELSQKAKNQIILAIDEACANAIIHGNKCDETRELNLELDFDDQRMRVDIFDIGDYQPVPSKVDEYDVNERVKNRTKGGLGLRLMHVIMDKVSYRDEGDKTICSLTKEMRNIDRIQNDQSGPR